MEGCVFFARVLSVKVVGGGEWTANGGVVRASARVSLFCGEGLRCRCRDNVRCFIVLQ